MIQATRPLNTKLNVKSFSKEAFNIQSFYKLSEFCAFSKDGKCYIYISALVDTPNFNPNYKYAFNTAPIPAEMIPNNIVSCYGIVCDTYFENPGIITLNIKSDGKMDIYSGVPAGNKWIKIGCEYSTNISKIY